MQVVRLQVRLRQVVRPRLLNDWAKLLKQFPACSQMGELFIPCLLAQVTMKQLLACSQMGELACSQSDKIGLQPGRGALA